MNEQRERREACKTLLSIETDSITKKTLQTSKARGPLALTSLSFKFSIDFDVWRKSFRLVKGEIKKNIKTEILVSLKLYT